MSLLVHVILSGNVPGVSPPGEEFVPAYWGKSLFQTCIERNASFAGRQLVVGHNEYYIHARGYFKSTGNKTYLSIIEEDRLTNIYSVAFAAFSTLAEEILLITPSNYLISDEASYKKAIEKMIPVAEAGKIGVLSLHPEKGLGNLPFIVCEEDKIKSLEVITDSKQRETVSESNKHFIYPGILCCKAGTYLQELKTWAPEIYQVVKNAWESRVAQYVAVDTNIKMPCSTIEQVLLTVSDKIEVVIEPMAKLQIPTKNNDEKSINIQNP